MRLLRSRSRPRSAAASADRAVTGKLQSHQPDAVASRKHDPDIPLLDLTDLSISYRVGRREVKAVDRVSLRLLRGDSVGVVGESGSGKSTLATALLGLLPPNATVTQGRALLRGIDLLRLPEEELNRVRWRHIAMVFQKAMGCLSPVHRIREQFYDVLAVHEPSITREAAVERAARLMAAVHLPASALAAYPHELSGGMTQRTMIALSLVHNPELLILDEATTALDVITQGQILSEVNRLKEEFGLATLMISHDISVVASTCRRIAVMYAGRVMEVGPISLVRAAAHPYTQLLTKSFPDLYGPRQRIAGIPGALPDLTALPRGCLFAPRCGYATAACHDTSPDCFRVGEGHYALCHLLAAQGGVSVERAY